MIVGPKKKKKKKKIFPPKKKKKKKKGACYGMLHRFSELVGLFGRA